jgi:hypothetical protein
MMKIRNQPELATRNAYNFYKAHFEYLWNTTRGKRVTLPIHVLQAKASAWVALVNRMEINIRMTGWQLSGQGASRPYSFSPEFTWRAGEKIVIAQNQVDLPGFGELLPADGDFLGDNTILRLTNASGALVGEWSMPQSPVE